MLLNRFDIALRLMNVNILSVMPKRYRYYWEARPENKWRKLMMQVTLPRLGPTPEYEAKVVEEDPNKLYGLDLVLHQEAKEIVRDCKMVIVFLKTQMEVTDYFRMRHELRKKDILLDEFPNHVMTYTLKDSPHKNLSALYSSGETLTIYSLEPNVAEMLKLTKKNPYVSLMGGLVENRLMSATQIVDYSKLPSLEVVRGMFSSSLSQICGSTYNLLQHNQAETTQYLQQYIKDKTQS